MAGDSLFDRIDQEANRPDARVDSVRIEAKRAKEMGAPAAGGDASSQDMHSHLFYRSCSTAINLTCPACDHASALADSKGQHACSKGIYGGAHRPLAASLLESNAFRPFRWRTNPGSEQQV